MALPLASKAMRASWALLVLSVSSRTGAPQPLATMCRLDQMKHLVDDDVLQ